MTRMNRVIPLIGLVVLAIAVAVVIKSRARQPAAPKVLHELPQAPAPDVDTPADTVRSLSAQVAELIAQTKDLTETNRRLREENTTTQQTEKRVAARVRADLNTDLEQARARDDNAITAMSQRLEKLGGLLAQSPPPSVGPPPADMPVGFGYGNQGLGGAVHWIEALDAPAAGSPQAPDFTAADTGSLLRPGLPGGQPGGQPGGDPALAYTAAGTTAVPTTTGAPGGPGGSVIEPVYTIPANATLTQSTAFSALIGRVPVGGQVHDPMPFKVLIGAENLAANGHAIPGLEGMVLSGVAVGDWTLACVSGSLTSATFVFEDGRVQTFGENPRGQGARGAGQDQRLGWISDRFGVPCISGKRITNAPGFLTQRIGLTALAAAAEAAAAAQTTNTVSDQGTANSTVTGDQGEFILGKTVAGGANEIGTWLTERQAQSFDAIFVAAGEPLVVHLDVTLAIDYDPTGRKLVYHARLNGPGGAYGYLD